MCSEQSHNPLLVDLMRQPDFDATEPARRRLETLDTIELLESVLDAGHDGSLIQSMCTDSYVHANGFYKLSFPFMSESPVRIRLHVWPQLDNSIAEGLPDAHNHQRPFVSRVLAGALSHDIMKVRTGAGPYLHFGYLTVRNGHRYVRSGRANLDIARVETTAAGLVYSMDSKTVHRVQTKDSAYAATLVIELAPSRGHTDVFVANGVKPEDVTVTPMRLTASKITAILSELVLRMNGR
jgi:hypothetical protein